jgi:starch phosphorylase
MIASGYFSPDDPRRFSMIVDSLLGGGDYYAVLADYASYVSCQDGVDLVYRDEAAWTRKAILNVAHSGRFSSDRAIREYGELIWNVSPNRQAPLPVATFD